MADKKQQQPTGATILAEEARAIAAALKDPNCRLTSLDLSVRSSNPPAPAEVNAQKTEEQEPPALKPKK